MTKQEEIERFAEEAVKCGRVYVSKDIWDVLTKLPKGSWSLYGRPLDGVEVAVDDFMPPGTLLTGDRIGGWVKWEYGLFSEAI